MQQLDFQEAIDQILRVDGRYQSEAYQFVREGLDFTMDLIKKQGHHPTRHVRGQELLNGLREFALDQFGPLAITVLNYWGIHRCEDFGEIVFNLVDIGVLGKTDEDSREDFKNGYEFDAAFLAPFRPAVKPTRSRTRSDAPPDHSPDSKPRVSGKKKLSSGPN